MINWTDELTTFAAAVAGALGTWLGLRRRYSKDTLENDKDKNERELMKRLVEERDLARADAREAWGHRIEDAKTIARLETEVAASHREVERLRDELFAVRIHVRKLTAIIVKMDPEAAAVLEADRPPPDGVPSQVFTQGPVHPQ